MQEKKLSTKAIVGIVVGVLAILAVILAVILMNKNKLTAMVMRLIRQEGEVALLDASGQDVVIMDNMKLYSGNALQTGSDGLVDLSLDDTKYLTIENQSQVVFEKSGKALELKLNSGRLFFNVTEKLADDETMDISTSTMVVGIRGTSGWVDAENSDLYIGDGTVRVKGINPKTGETIEAEFTAGQKVHVYLLDEDGKTVAFELENYTIEDVPREMLRNIVQYPELFERFVDATGFEPKAVIREAIIKKILPDDMVLPEEYEELLEEVIEEMKEPEEEEEEEEEPEEVEEVETPTTNPTVPPQEEEETPPAETPPAQQSTTTTETTPTTYSVATSASPAEGGSATPSVSSAEAGTTITLTATPNAGYSFSGWTVTSGSVSLADAAATTTTFTLGSENVAVTANFTELERRDVTISWYAMHGSLSVSATKPGTATTNPEQVSEQIVSAYDGETITLTANPEQGYAVRWISDMLGFSANGNSATIVMDFEDAVASALADFDFSYFTTMFAISPDNGATGGPAFQAYCNGTAISDGQSVNVPVAYGQDTSSATVTIEATTAFSVWYNGSMYREAVNTNNNGRYYCDIDLYEEFGTDTQALSFTINNL